MCLKAISRAFHMNTHEGCPPETCNGFLVGTLLIMATLLVVHDGVLVGRLRLRVDDAIQDGFPILSAIYPF